jgi:very-short-patch-repair endonuclease
MTIKQYLDIINKLYKLDNATEHSFLGDLQQQLESLVQGRTPNLNPEIIKQIADKLGLTFVPEKFPSTGGVSAHEGGWGGRNTGGVSAHEGGRDGRNTKNYMNLPYNPNLKERAKKLRQAGNLSEVLFWNQVKNKQFKGFDFDRQKIVGNYIVDFYCSNCNVVIEIDGSSHDNKQEYDEARDSFLQSLGLTVIHIPVIDVMKNMGGVMEMLFNHPALKGTPPLEGNLETEKLGTPPVEGNLEAEELGTPPVEGNLETEKLGTPLVEGNLETEKLGTPLAEGNLETEGLGTTREEGNFAPIDILDYIYAVLHSPTYREKYKEFLKIDFPRVPYPKDKETFWQLVKLGGKIRQIHLLESPIVEEYITQYPEDGDNIVTKPHNFPIPQNEKTGDLQGNVYINETQYFANVPLKAWKFYIGGYQPAQKWLKDRKDRKLEFDDILHYQKIIVALNETDRLMKEIDSVATSW